LKTVGRSEINAGSADPSGFDLIANATPLGMKAGDPYPVDASRLEPGMFVGCVITSPAVSPLVLAARSRGCPTSTGIEMYNALQDLMVDFLIAREGTRR
jgi:shikimate dehydrogenase